MSSDMGESSTAPPQLTNLGLITSDSNRPPTLSTETAFVWNDLQEDIKTMIRDMVLQDTAEYASWKKVQKCSDSFTKSCPEWLCDESFWHKLCTQKHWDEPKRTLGIHKMDETDPQKWRKQFNKWCGLRFTDRYELQEAIDALLTRTNGTCIWPSNVTSLPDTPENFTHTSTEWILMYGPIDTWDVSEVKSMSQLFAQKYFQESNIYDKFNADISSWDVSNVTSMIGMFSSATSFNQNLNGWNVSNVKDMERMFQGAANFNNGYTQNNDSNRMEWTVSKVRDMRGMFHGAVSFNAIISDWDVSNVQDMQQMFESAIVFNQDLSKWNVSNVRHLRRMFRNAKKFNNGEPAMQSTNPLTWDVSNVQEMEGMFDNAENFNQHLSFTLPDDVD